MIMTDSLPLLTVTELTLCRGGRPVLKNIHCDLKAGETLLIRGANGSGKSTFLRALAGLLPPQSGTIRWRGNAIRQLGQNYHNDVRYLGHRDGLKTALTVQENLSFICAWHGITATGGSVESALTQFGAKAWRHRLVRILSAGQRRRVALAAMMASKGRLWLLDEPSTSLDQDSIGWLLTAVNQHCAAGGATVIATHDHLAVDAIQTLKLDPMG